MITSQVVVFLAASLASAFGLSGGCRWPLVEITVSPVVSKRSARVMDLSWDVEGWEEGDWVGLYEGRPASGGRLLFLGPANASSGWIRTGLQEQRTPAQDPVFQKTCSKYWAAYWKQHSTAPVVASCLGTNPRWMEESRDIIKNLRLRDVFFPGTHDSGSFIISSKPFKENRYQKYVYTQDETVMDQLLHGARYLDFRVGHYKGVWWLNHDIVRVHPLEFPLGDLREFLKNTNEIVVLDLHRFPVGFKEKSVHESFVSYLERELSGLIAPPWLGWDATLAEVWATGKRLILAYNHREAVSEFHHVLWWPVRQIWANTLHVQRLHDHIKNVIDSDFIGVPWAAMAQLTPTAWSVITDKHKGLRGLAEATNRNVTEWFRGDWGKTANAVAVDFLRSTGVVEAAIRWNKRRARGSHCDLMK